MKWRHSQSSNPRHIAAVSQMCNNIGVIDISVKNALIHRVTLTFQPQNHTIGYPKVMPYTKFEHSEIILFWVMLQTNRQTDRQTNRQTHKQTDTQTEPNILPTPTNSVGVGKNHVNSQSVINPISSVI